jgi:hypothetical protein
MRIRGLLLAAALVIPMVGRAAEPSPSPDSSTPKIESATGSSYAERLAVAKSVKVVHSILGIELGMEMDKAAARLDKLSDPKQPPKREKPEPGERGEHEKSLWQLLGTDYSAILLASDGDERVTSIDGYLRPGKEIPFSKIGPLEKAPVRNDTLVAWDVVGSKQPLFRVVARGKESKAVRLTIYIVERGSRPGDEK